MRREAFSTPGSLRLDLRLPAGEIDVESVDGDETIVELSSTRDGDDAREVIDGARIELRRRGDGHEVLVDVERKRFRFFDFGRGDIVLRVTAPHGADLELSTASADVSGRGRFGELEADLASGDLELPEIGGRANVKSASGDVRIAAIGGEASVNTASGDVRVGRVGGNGVMHSASGDISIDEAAASLTLQTASGDLRVSSIESGRVTLQSASGDQHVGVRRGTRVLVDAKTMSGETTSDLDVSDDASTNGSEVELRATTMSGDIRIVRA